MSRSPIELSIEALVLRNLPHEQRYQIAASVERTLLRLVSEQGLPPSLAQGSYIPRLTIDQFPLIAGASADAIGEQIAQAIYSKLASGKKIS
jgi:hypothetical protein